MPSIIRSSTALLSLLVASATADESSDFYDRGAYLNHSLQVTITGSETVKLYASNDGITWVQVGADITASGMVQLAGIYPFLKVVRGSGTAPVSATLFSGNRAQD